MGAQLLSLQALLCPRSVHPLAGGIAWEILLFWLASWKEDVNSLLHSFVSWKQQYSIRDHSLLWVWYWSLACVCTLAMEQRLFGMLLVPTSWNALTKEGCLPSTQSVFRCLAKAWQLTICLASPSCCCSGAVPTDLPAEWIALLGLHLVAYVTPASISVVVHLSVHLLLWNFIVIHWFWIVRHFGFFATRQQGYK